MLPRVRGVMEGTTVHRWCHYNGALRRSSAEILGIQVCKGSSIEYSAWVAFSFTPHFICQLSPSERLPADDGQPDDRPKT